MMLLYNQLIMSFFLSIISPLINLVIRIFIYISYYHLYNIESFYLPFYTSFKSILKASPFSQLINFIKLTVFIYIIILYPYIYFRFISYMYSSSFTIVTMKFMKINIKTFHVIIFMTKIYSCKNSIYTF